jgi:hypothetical protein
MDEAQDATILKRRFSKHVIDQLASCRRMEVLAKPAAEHGEFCTDFGEAERGRLSERQCRFDEFVELSISCVGLTSACERRGTAP